MNFPGGISPRSGCLQRTSDSAPTSLPEKMSHWGQKGIGILESIVNMARLMGLPIIVEGVENLQQENVLRSMGCQ